MTLITLNQSFWDKHPPATTKKLYLGHLNLKTIPPKVFEYKELTDLSLEGNELTQISDKIAELTKLVSINLSNNKLKTLPNGMGSLPALKFIWATDNLIDSLPIEFCTLKPLKELALSNNQLTILPENFVQLTNLELLDLSENKLASLPITFGHLTKMRKLALEDNLLTILPDSISKLENMHELSLKGNKLNAFPKFLLEWSKIEYTEWLGLGKFYNAKTLKSYFSIRDKYIKKGWEDRTDWLAAFYLLTNQAKELDQLDRKHILKSLFIKQSSMNATALDYITKYTSNTFISKPLSEGSSVAVLGKLKSLSEEDLIQYFESKKILYTFSITKETSHILLNLPLKPPHLSTINLLDHVVLINEGNIKDLQNPSDTTLYLLDKTDESKENLKKVKSLLFSSLDADKWIALELMKAGGYDKTLINELFIAHQTAKDMKLRLAIESCANVHLSPKGKTALKHFGFKEGMPDHKLWTRFKKHIIPNTEFDGAYIAQVFYQRFKLGYNFILRATSSEEIKAFLKKNITNNVLCFTGHHEFPPLPNEVNEFKNLEKIILHNCGVKIFPKVLLQNKLPKLKEIDFGDSHPPQGAKNAKKLLKNCSILYKEWL